MIRLAHNDFFRSLALGDIPGYPHYTHGRARCVAHHRRRYVRVKDLPILFLVCNFSRKTTILSVFVQLATLGCVGIQEVDGLAQDFGFRISEDLFGGSVELHDIPVHIHGYDHVQRTVDEVLRVILGRPQCVVGPLARDSIPDGPHEQVAVDLPLDETILCPLPDCLHRYGFIVEAAQHDNWNVGRLGADPGQRVKSVVVWSGQIEQDHVGAASGQALEAGREPIHALDGE